MIRISIDDVGNPQSGTFHFFSAFIAIKRLKKCKVKVLTVAIAIFSPFYGAFYIIIFMTFAFNDNRFFVFRSYWFGYFIF
jgi:hypothetical protein